MGKNMKIYIPLLILIIGTLFFTSCSSNEDVVATASDNSSSDNSSSDNSSSDGAAISTFTGTFNGECAGAYAKTDMMVITDNKTAAEGQIVYSDSGCSTKEYGHNINYTVESTVTATVDNKSVSKIEGTTTTSFHTIYTDDRVSNANSGSWCGKSDWVKDTPKDVTGLDCSDDFGTTYGAAGVKKYDIWYISGNTFMHSEFNSDGYASSLDYTKTKE
jgi:hypothetical protein